MDLMAIAQTVQGFQNQLNDIHAMLKAGPVTPAQPQIPQQKIDELLSDQQRKLIALYQEYMAANPEEAEKMDSVLSKFGAHVREHLTAVDPPPERRPPNQQPQRRK